MAAGDIVYARVPITLDPDAVEDSAVNTVLAGLFPILTYDVIHTSLEKVTDTTGVAKAILVVVAQAII